MLYNKFSIGPDFCYTIFNSMDTHFLHFELTCNMAANELINALKRMINRQGLCRQILRNETHFEQASVKD